MHLLKLDIDSSFTSYISSNSRISIAITPPKSQEEAHLECTQHYALEATARTEMPALSSLLEFLLYWKKLHVASVLNP